VGWVVGWEFLGKTALNATLHGQWCKLRMRRLYAPTAPWLPCFSVAVFGGPNSCPWLWRQSSSVKHHCQAVPQRELVRKSC